MSHRGSRDAFEAVSSGSSVRHGGPPVSDRRGIRFGSSKASRAPRTATRYSSETCFGRAKKRLRA